MRRAPGLVRTLSSANESPEACAARWRTVEPGGPAGVSQSTAPSSTAMSVAYAVSSFVTEASRNTRAVSPAVVTESVTTAAATWSTGQSSTVPTANRRSGIAVHRDRGAADRGRVGPAEERDDLGDRGRGDRAGGELLGHPATVGRGVDNRRQHGVDADVLW